MQPLEYYALPRRSVQFPTRILIFQFKHKASAGDGRVNPENHRKKDIGNRQPPPTPTLFWLENSQAQFVQQSQKVQVGFASKVVIYPLLVQLPKSADSCYLKVMTHQIGCAVRIWSGTSRQLGFSVQGSVSVAARLPS